MCSVSAVMDYGKQQWPNVIGPGWDQTKPIIHPTSSPAEIEALKAFKEMVKKAEEFDKAADQEHCEDDEKLELMRRIDQRLKLLIDHLGVKEG